MPAPEQYVGDHTLHVSDNGSLVITDSNDGDTVIIRDGDLYAFLQAMDGLGLLKGLAWVIPDADQEALCDVCLRTNNHHITCPRAFVPAAHRVVRP